MLLKDVDLYLQFLTEVIISLIYIFLNCLFILNAMFIFHVQKNMYIVLLCPSL